MAWTDTKVDGSSTLTAEEWNEHVSDQLSRAKVSYGSGNPTTDPTMIGEIYIDTDSSDIYLAKGTTSADWVQLTEYTDFSNHISDTSIHFQQSEISISTSQITDFSTSDITVNSLVSNTTITFDTEVSATASIDWSQGNKQSITLTEDVTLTFTDPDGPCNLILKIVQDSVGGHNITWPSNVKWEGGNTPDLSSDEGNSVRIASFYFDGTNYYGQITDVY